MFKKIVCVCVGVRLLTIKNVLLTQMKEGVLKSRHTFIEGDTYAI